MAFLDFEVTSLGITSIMNPISVRCDTCLQFYITRYGGQNNDGNITLGFYNVAWLRNYVCQSKSIAFAHENALPRSSKEPLRTGVLRIFDSSASGSSDDSAPSPNRSYTLSVINDFTPTY